MPTPSIISSKMDEVRSLCIKHGVVGLHLFGSAATDRFREESSDLDFLVEFSNPIEAGIASRFLGLAEDLESLFGRPVDLITKASVRNPVFKEQLAQHSQPLYAA